MNAQHIEMLHEIRDHYFVVEDGAGARFTLEHAALNAAIAALAAPKDAEEMSPEFTDSARAALAWVLYHHQGGSSPVGQPIRFALGMGVHDPIPDWRIAEAKRWAEWSRAKTADFHAANPPGDQRQEGDTPEEAALFEAGRKAWADVPDAAEWVREIRGEASPPPEAAAAVPVTDAPRRVGWMVESKKGDGWWTGHARFDWTKDPNKAAVFYSFREADFQADMHRGDAFASEHVWLSPASQRVEAAAAVDPVQWLRDNYDAHPNIATLCDAMQAALASPTGPQPAGGDVA